LHSVRHIIDAAISAPRFSGSRLAKELLPVLLAGDCMSEPLKEAWSALGERSARHVAMGLVRAVFLIELVNEKVTSTKFERRWGPRLQRDPRGCSFEECCEIFAHLVDQPR
jgi:hypothetical protein